MKKVKLFFPKEMKYGDRVYRGNMVHEISEEIPGFINRWLKRGCTEVKEEIEPEVKVKPFRKKTTKKKPVKEKVVEEVKEINNIEEPSEEL